MTSASSPSLPVEMVLVPREPTPEMLLAYSTASMQNLMACMTGDDPDATDPAAPYRAMLAAAPQSLAAHPGAQEAKGPTDTQRLDWLLAEELRWYPSAWNGNKAARWDLYWECEESDLRAAIDAQIAAQAAQPKDAA